LVITDSSLDVLELFFDHSSSFVNNFLLPHKIYFGCSTA